MSPQVHFLDLTLKSLPPAQFFIQIFPLFPTVALGLWCTGCGLGQQNKSVWTRKLSRHKARPPCTMIVQEWPIRLSRAAGCKPASMGWAFVFFPGLVWAALQGTESDIIWSARLCYSGSSKSSSLWPNQTLQEGSTEYSSCGLQETQQSDLAETWLGWAQKYFTKPTGLGRVWKSSGRSGIHHHHPPLFFWSFLVFIYFIIIIILILAALGLHCWAQALRCGAQASLIVEHGL